MSESYSVVLTGKLLNDESLDDVKAKVGSAFKLTPAQLDKLFGGKPVALKRGLDKKQAVRLSTRLQQLGAHAVIKAAVAKPAVAPTPAKPEEPFTDIVAAMPETGAEPPAPEEQAAEPAAAAEPEPAAVELVAEAAASVADEEPAAEPSVVEPLPVSEAAAAEPVDHAPVAINSVDGGENITCPRCGHEQPFTTACGHCKMDLTMHIKRMERRAKVLAARQA